MGWDFNKVKPWVKSAGELLGKQFGIKNIGGWRSQGSVPGSLHPKGRALDMMTSSRSKGDALAAAAVANHKQLGITEVIWWRRIWTPSRGWHPYSGPSDHTDHVHLSFGEKAGTGKPDLGGILSGAGGIVAGAIGALGDPTQSLTGAIGGIGRQLATIGEGIASVGKVAESITKLFLPNNLLRAGAATAGTLFVLIGIWFMSREARNG